MSNSKLKTSLTTFARANCANWNPHAGCWLTEKVDWLDKDNVKTTAGSCRVADGQPCDYFRESVLDASDCPFSVREAYFRIDCTVGVKKARLCPECGSELGYRQRTCSNCARNHRRESYRRRRQKQCMSAPQLMAI